MNLICKCGSSHVHFVHVDQNYFNKGEFKDTDFALRKDGVVDIYFGCEICNRTTYITMTSRKGEMVISSNGEINECI